MTAITKLDPEVVLEALTGSRNVSPESGLRLFIEAICSDFNETAREIEKLALDRSWDLRTTCTADKPHSPENVVVIFNGTVITPGSGEFIEVDRNEFDVETHAVKFVPAPLFTPVPPLAPEVKRLFASWKCLGQQCPDRPGKESPFSPLCYTCGEEMTKV